MGIKVISSWILVFDWRSVVQYFDWQLFVWDSMLLLVFLHNVVGSFQTTSELLQCSDGFVEFVELLVVSFWELTLSPQNSQSKFWLRGTKKRDHDVKFHASGSQTIVIFVVRFSRHCKPNSWSVITKCQVSVNIKITLSSLLPVPQSCHYNYQIFPFP